MRRRLTVGSLFTGIGGIDYAFQQAGFNITWQVEIDDYCQQVLNKNFPDVSKHFDINNCRNLPHVDVITAGFPCQPFSIAGKRLGADDERFLIPEMLRVITEVNPDVVFLENVPHFATINDGNEFRQLLEWFAENGYDAQWQHIRATDAGAPHRRERWFCVAYKDVPNTAELGNTEPQRRKGQWTTWQQVARTRHDTRLPKSPSDRSPGAGLALEPRLGRDVDGLPNRLDGHQFPAGRDQPQHDSEPPRVTTRTDKRRDRIKALGNAVVPQVIYPTALQIKTYLLEQ